jgi:1,4-alpha-glucan branching enzyme
LVGIKKKPSITVRPGTDDANRKQQKSLREKGREIRPLRKYEVHVGKWS